MTEIFFCLLKIEVLLCLIFGSILYEKSQLHDNYEISGRDDQTKVNRVPL